MPSKEELERLPLTALAVLCKKVAHNPEKYTSGASALAVRMQEDWLRLQGAPSPSLKDQQEVERKQAKLREQIVLFLADILH